MPVSGFLALGSGLRTLDSGGSSLQLAHDSDHGSSLSGKEEKHVWALETLNVRLPRKQSHPRQNKHGVKLRALALAGLGRPWLGVEPLLWGR